MTVQAQNALLKTIEEPPSYAVLILITANPDAFLPTILSRCVQLKLKPLRDSILKNQQVGILCHLKHQNIPIPYLHKISM